MYENVIALVGAGVFPDHEIYMEMWGKFKSNLPVWIMVLLSESIGVLESQI